jgi:hypothetical protein
MCRLLSAGAPRLRALCFAMLVLVVPGPGNAQTVAKVATSLPEVAALRLILDSVGPRYRVAIGSDFLPERDGGVVHPSTPVGYQLVDSLRQQRPIRASRLTDLLTCSGEGAKRECRMDRDDLFLEVSRPSISGDTATVYVRMRQPSPHQRSGTFYTLFQYRMRRVGAEWHLIQRRIAARS